MALLTFGGGITAMTGSMAGNTFAKTAGGYIIKAKSNPTAGVTAKSRVSKLITGQLSKVYSVTLSPNQHAAWKVFAASNPYTSNNGLTKLLTGHNLFIKLNYPLMEYGYSINLDPPADRPQNIVNFLNVIPTSGNPGTILITGGVLGPVVDTLVLVSCTPALRPGIRSKQSALRDLPITIPINIATDVTDAYLANFGTTPTGPGQRIIVQIQAFNTDTGWLSAPFEVNELWL